MILTLDEVKDLIEKQYELDLYARTIDGINYLTEFGKPYINILWHTEAKGDDVFWLDVRESETSKGFLFSTYFRYISLDQVLVELQPYAKKKRQTSLFGEEMIDER